MGVRDGEESAGSHRDIQVSPPWVKSPNKPAGINLEAAGKLPQAIPAAAINLAPRAGSCYSSRRFGPKIWALLPSSRFPQASGFLMWVLVSGDTMKYCCLLLPGCRTQGVNAKFHPGVGRGAASAPLESWIKPQMESKACSPLISSPGSPGTLCISHLSSSQRAEGSGDATVTSPELTAWHSTWGHPHADGKAIPPLQF